MANFAIIELDDGLTVIELPSNEAAEDVAVLQGGILVDPGPYPSYEAACDALDELQFEEDE